MAITLNFNSVGRSSGLRAALRLAMAISTVLPALTHAVEVRSDLAGARVIGGTPAVVINVIQTSGDRQYRAGDTVRFRVQFDRAVVVDTSGGVPTILLETGATDRLAVYESGAGSSNLVFAYAVQVGDVSVDLQYASSASFTTNGGTLVDVDMGSDVNLSLPPLASAFSLASTSAVQVETPQFDNGFE